MKNAMIEEYASVLAQLCLPLPTQRDDSNASASPNDTRSIVERWLDAPGWTDQPPKQRAKSLQCFAKKLRKMWEAPIPLEWLIFPFTASRVLRKQAQTETDIARQRREKSCADALQHYAMALQIADYLPACDFVLGYINDEPTTCCMMKHDLARSPHEG